jgi:Xaa-Pro aminopeptidase
MEKIEKLISSNKSSAFLFMDQRETFYLTQAPFDGFALLIAGGKCYALCSIMIKDQVEDFFGNEVEISVNNNFIENVKTILSRQKSDVWDKNLIVDSLNISSNAYFSLENELSGLGIKILSQKSVLEKFRIIKNPDEIENIKIACDIVSEVCQKIKSELTEGISEIDIHYRVLELFAQRHSIMSFTPIIAAGSNSANPHHASSNYKIKPDDMVLIDIGCKYKGYCSDLTRTYFLNRISDERTKIWDIVKKSHDIVIEQIKAGLPINWADEAAREIISKAGYKDKFIHNTGHGIGIEVHEPPSLNPKAEGVFLDNMVVTVEPGIYLKNSFGVRIEDTILITKNGCEVLTKAPY